MGHGVRGRRIPQRIPGEGAARRRRPDGPSLQHDQLGASIDARLVVRRGGRRSAHRADPQGQRQPGLAARAAGHHDRQRADVAGQHRRGAASARQAIHRMRSTWPTRDPKTDATAMSLARIRQLSAHEVGHTLGFTHNFAASTYGRASVMDYPAPMAKITDGRLDLSDAYGVGIGAFDTFAVKYAYTPVRPRRRRSRRTRAPGRRGHREGHALHRRQRRAGRPARRTRWPACGTTAATRWPT